MNTINLEVNKQEVDSEQKQPHLKKILIAVCIALMAVIASVSGLNVAQPMLALEFNVSQNTVLWMINIYTLTLAALLLPLGAIGDRHGRKKMLLIGLTLFSLASVLSGVATNSTMMLIARFLTGIGAAMIMPVTLAVITSTFPTEERSKAIGIWTGVAGGGGILGMYLSALLVDVATWRWLFILPVILAVISIVMTTRFVPNSTEKTAHKFDILGSILSVLATVGIIFALHELPSYGLREPFVLISLIIGIAGVVGFIFCELRQQAPLLDIRLFCERGLSSGSITLLTVFGVQAGIFIVLFPFFQGVLGWSGLRSTLAMMPMAVLMMVSSGLAPKLAPRIGNKNTMALGIGLGALGAMLMAGFVSVELGYLSILPGLIVMGVGMGFSMTPSTEAITSSLPADRQGVASALNDITREFGTALGIALLGPLVTTGYSSAITEKLNGFSEQVVTKAKEGLAHAQLIAPSTGNQEELLVSIARESFITGWQQAMWVGAGVMVLLFVYILVRGTKTIPSMTAIMCVALLLLSTSCNGQTNKEHKQHQSGHSHQAFADKEAVEKMAKNFESTERDSLQQPQKVLQFMGNLNGKKIMDIGAATGYFSIKFANVGATVIAADVSVGFQEYLKNRIAKDKLENIELRKIPYDNPLLKENEVDIVFVANTYHHIENRVAYFSEVNKGLKPDGELIVVDYFKVEFKEKIQAPAMAMRVSVDEVIFELKKAGFDSFDIEVNLLAYQYIFRAKKKYDRILGRSI